MPPSSNQRWEVRFTADADRWYKALSAEDRNRIGAAIDALRDTGPTLGRPFVGSIERSRHHNMKELRSKGGNLRALFAFDPQRRAVVLVGGDKTDNWRGWYRQHVPLADRLYEGHLRNIGKEGPWRQSSRGAGRQSDGRSL